MVVKRELIIDTYLSLDSIIQKKDVLCRGEDDLLRNANKVRFTVGVLKKKH